ncbi:Uncharacterised protein g8042 [Pycnogonum litorale]
MDPSSISHFVDVSECLANDVQCAITDEGVMGISCVNSIVQTSSLVTVEPNEISKSCNSTVNDAQMPGRLLVGDEMENISNDDGEMSGGHVVSPAEVMQVIPSSFIALQPELEIGSDIIMDCNNIILSNDMVIEQNVEVGSYKESKEGDIILVQNSDFVKPEVIRESEIILHSNVTSDLTREIIIQERLFKDDSNYRCDPEDHSYDPFQNLVIETDCKVDDGMNASPHKCPECESSFKTRAKLKRHIRMFHSNGGAANFKKTEQTDDEDAFFKILSCPACLFSTSHRGKMDKHVQRHVAEGYHPSGKKRSHPNQPLLRQRHKAEEYQCEYCPYSCTVEKALKKHLKLHNNKTKEFTLKVSCKICGKDRPNDAELKKHMKKHVSGDNFLCDVCGFTSVQLKKIIQHRRMHTGERPHLCPFCSYRSARRDNLRSHVRRMHKKENMYSDTFNPTEVADESANPDEVS